MHPESIDAGNGATRINFGAGLPDGSLRRYGQLANKHAEYALQFASAAQAVASVWQNWLALTFARTQAMHAGGGVPPPSQEALHAWL